MPEVDFAGVPDQKEWKPAPSGDYVLELVDAEEGGTIKSGPNKGQPLDKLQFEIVDCVGDLEEFNGRRIYENATYGEKALPRLKTMLKAFGVQGVEDGPLSFEWDELLGQKLRAKIRSVGPQRDKNDSSIEYPAKNVITRYLVEKDEEE
jgi:hypothetical protein